MRRIVSPVWTVDFSQVGRVVGDRGVEGDCLGVGELFGNGANCL